MKRLFQLFTSLLAVVLFSGCPADTDITPAFLEITDFNLRTPGIADPTEAITEVWAFADNVFLGVFPLPARIPVPQVGTVEVRLEAGVRQNGISTTPEIYEFYTPVERTLELVAGETTALGTLDITYRSDVQFAIFEDFEDGTSRAFTEIVLGDTTLVPTTELVRSGSFSGKLPLTSDNRLVEIATGEQFGDLIATRPYVWLEVDFLSEAPAIWGVTGNRGIAAIRLFDPGFNVRDNWTKIYFNLSAIVVESDLEQLRIALSALLPEELASGNVYLDNIKLLHF